MAEETKEFVKEVSTEASRTVKLVSSDSAGPGEIFEVSINVALMSDLVKTMYDTEDTKEGDEIQEIPLPNVSSDVLRKVLKLFR